MAVHGESDYCRRPGMNKSIAASNIRELRREPAEDIPLTETVQSTCSRGAIDHKAEYIIIMCRSGVVAGRRRTRFMLIFLLMRCTYVT